jgi:hypothetical protein
MSSSGSLGISDKESIDALHETVRVQSRATNYLTIATSFLALFQTCTGIYAIWKPEWTQYWHSFLV